MFRCFTDDMFGIFRSIVFSIPIEELELSRVDIILFLLFLSMSHGFFFGEKYNFLDSNSVDIRESSGECVPIFGEFKHSKFTGF